MQVQLDNDWIYGRTALAHGIPWITPKAFLHLEKIVKPEWRVFEWGSGGSTVYWARKCEQVISVEHNIEWVTRTAGMLAERKLDNFDIHYIRGLYDGLVDHYKPYADVILTYPDDYFDLVYIDGEATSRKWCLENCLSKVKGWILCDNSNWLEDNLGGWEKHEYSEHNLRWVGQDEPFSWHTTLLERQQKGGYGY